MPSKDFGVTVNNWLPLSLHSLETKVSEECRILLNGMKADGNKGSNSVCRKVGDM